MGIRARLLSGFLLLILIFLIDFIINQKLSSEVIRNSSYLSNSEIIIRNSNMLHKYMIDMQGAFRGYLLTGQEAFLDPYYEGIHSIPGLIREQKTMLDNKKQQERLDAITMLHDQWVKYADALIIAKQDTLPEAGAKYQYLFEKKVRVETGKKLNDSIRAFFADFDEYEYSLRQNRRHILEESIIRTRRISFVIAILSIVCAIVCSFLIVHSISKRISKMVRFAEEISMGEFNKIDDQRKDELKKLSIALNKMSFTLDRNFEDLKKKNKELDQFAYVVSHDLKAPLRGVNNILIWTEEDHGHELSEEVQKNLSLIRGRVTRLENMINGLLEYARIGRTKENIREVNVGEILAELCDILIPSTFKVHIQSEMPIIETERLRLEQVFSNLISNAVKHHNNTEGTITIEHKDAGAYYEFSVIDDGPGIPLEYHEKIFTIFQTLKERDAFESTGVGLAIVKKILDDQKGAIKLISGIKGSIFIFTWPKNLMYENSIEQIY